MEAKFGPTCYLSLHFSKSDDLYFHIKLISEAAYMIAIAPDF